MKETLMLWHTNFVFILLMKYESSPQNAVIRTLTALFAAKKQESFEFI